MGLNTKLVGGKSVVKVRRSKKGGKYVVVEIPESGLHISIHRSGHVHVKDKTGLHADIEGDRRLYFLSPNLEKFLLNEDLMFRPCEKYPDCICLDLILNLKLIENKSYGELCRQLKKFFKGGPCPVFHGILCMWSGFCKADLDPSPYARKL